MVMPARMSPAFRSSIAGWRKGASLTASPLAMIRTANTAVEPAPSVIITCPTGSVWLAILISRSTSVKHPIAATIRKMLRRFALDIVRVGLSASVILMLRHKAGVQCSAEAGTVTSAVSGYRRRGGGSHPVPVAPPDDTVIMPDQSVSSARITVFGSVIAAKGSLPFRVNSANAISARFRCPIFSSTTFCVAEDVSSPMIYL